MDPITQLRDWLSKYPDVRTEGDSRSITVLPLDDRGFRVSLNVDGSADNEFCVSYEGWHEDFSSAEDALKCFAFGLSEGCRLRVRKSWFFCTYTVESLQDGQWVAESTTGYPYLSWRWRNVEFFQNRLLPANPTVARDG